MNSQSLRSLFLPASLALALTAMLPDQSSPHPEDVSLNKTINDLRVRSRHEITQLTGQGKYNEALWSAVLSHHDLSTVRNLLDKGADPNFEKNGSPVLGLSVDFLHSNSEITRALLLKGADPSKIASYDNRSPLWTAVYNKHKKSVALLIAAGADVNATCREGETPLHAAAMVGAWEITDMLLKAGAKPYPMKALSVYSPFEVEHKRLPFTEDTMLAPLDIAKLQLKLWHEHLETEEGKYLISINFDGAKHLQDNGSDLERTIRVLSNPGVPRPGPGFTLLDVRPAIH